jgi:endoglucanase
MRLRASAALLAWVAGGVVCVSAAGASVVLAAGGGTKAASHLTASASVSTAPQLHVSGNELVNAKGQRVILHGVDRSGGEWACSQGVGIWDGPMDQASVSVIKSWGVNAVRLPVNEACWNGDTYINSGYRGAPYRSAVEAYVSLLNRNGLVAILDLALSDGLYTGTSAECKTARATCEKPMPDKTEAAAFWSAVARTFKGNDAVIFDLFNEPFPEAAVGTEAGGWRCWLLGGSACTGLGYQAVGMQSLVNTVRATGAKNVIMLGGITWATDMTQWLKYEPTDPDHNLAASWHSYNFNTCATVACWNNQIAPVIKRVPLVVGEIGENDCADTYIDTLMAWLDARSTSYLAWSWNADFGCKTGPSLITNYTGTATAFGAGYEAHLQSLRSAAARKKS